MGKIGIGLVGFGAIARKHLAAMRACSDVEIVGVFDPDSTARAAAAAENLRMFEREDDIFAAPGLCGVVLATPNRIHAEGAVRCIERGIPVLVEKPVADSAESGERILAAQRRFATPVLVGHHRRHNPFVAKAREIVRSGRIGTVTAIACSAMFLKPDGYFDVAWRREPGGGPVLINLIHDIDCLRFICGEIVAVGAMTSAVRRGHAVEDTAAAIARFDNGALATIVASDAVAAPWSWELTSGENPDYPCQNESCYLIAGTRGSLAVPQLELWTYEGASGWHAPLSRQTIPVEAADPFSVQLRHFIDVIRGRAEPLVSAADGLRTLNIALAIQRAAMGDAAAIG